MRVIDKAACDMTYAYAREKHAGAKRRTINLLTGKRHPYAESHVRGVRELSMNLASIIPLPPEEEYLLEKHGLDLLAHMAHLHDIPEDCEPELCRNGDHCNGEHINEDGVCTALQQEIRKVLRLLIRSEEQSNEVERGVSALTKNPFVSKNQRRKEQAFRLRSERFITKIVKLADNIYNLKTLRGTPFKQAMKLYIDIREAWGIMFTYQEMEILANAGVMEDPQTMAVFTHMYKVFWAQDNQGELSDEEIEMAEKSFHAIVEPFTQSRGIGLWISPEALIKSPLEKIETLLAFSVSMQSRGLVTDNVEPELLSCMQMESDTLRDLEFAELRGLEMTRMHIRLAEQINCDISDGEFSYTDPSIIASAQTILHHLGMTGREFLENVRTETQFKTLIEGVLSRIKTKDESEEVQGSGKQ